MTFGLLYNGTFSYLRRIWNVADFAIILFSVLSFLKTLSDDFNTVKVLRVMRLVRCKNPGRLQTAAVKALVLAIPNISIILILFVLFLLVFGVITVSQFKG
jgi:hypothetical protein